MIAEGKPYFLMCTLLDRMMNVRKTANESENMLKTQNIPKKRTHLYFDDQISAVTTSF